MPPFCQSPGRHIDFSACIFLIGVLCIQSFLKGLIFAGAEQAARCSWLQSIMSAGIAMPVCRGQGHIREKRIILCQKTDRRSVPSPSSHRNAVEFPYKELNLKAQLRVSRSDIRRKNSWSPSSGCINILLFISSAQDAISSSTSQSFVLKIHQA